MNGKHQLVVPKTLVKEVIALNHDSIYAAHPGRKGRWKFCASVTTGQE
jgi:hypothetical protein